MAAPDVDPRALQELHELQEKVLVQTDVASKLAQQERLMAIQKQRCVLTKQELQSMPDETPMFKGIGRAYFCSPKAEVVKELEDKVAQYEADAKKMKDQRDAVDAKMRDTESEIRELLKQSPSLIRRLGAVRLG